MRSAPTADAPLPSLPTPEEALLTDERTDRLLAALGKLSPAQQAVLRLALLRDAPLSEIAGVLGMALPTAKSHVRRGMIQLRRLLEGGD